MAAPGQTITCPACGKSIPADAYRCRFCEAVVSGTGATAPNATMSSSAAQPSSLASMLAPTPAPDYADLKAKDRVQTAILLMIVGFLLAWIPDVDILAYLLMFIALILFWLSRWAYGKVHHRYLLVGGGLIVVGILGTIALLAVLVSAAIGAVQQSSGNATAVIHSIKMDLYPLVIGSVIISGLISLGEALLVYGLADPVTRKILLGAFLVSVIVGAVVAALILPGLTSALNQSAVGSTLNTGPINNFEAQDRWLGVAGVVGDLLFALAYYRVRDQLKTTGKAGVPTS